MEITKNDRKEEIMAIKSVILINVFAILTAIAFSVPGCATQDETMKVIENLAHSSKIIESDLVLEEFVKGGKTTGVIVSLLEPESFRQNTESVLLSAQRGKNFKNPGFREELRRAVRVSQEKVINRLDPEKVKITNRFVYVFGFSAEVTLEGLKELEELEEITSISKDRVLEMHPGKEGGSVKY
jgi:hypothetical protein